MRIEKLAEDILRESKRVGIDPYKDAFRARDLGLDASDYVSFSYWCENTTSANWSGYVCLEVAETDRSGKPFKYRLLPESKWKYPDKSNCEFLRSIYPFR